METMPVFILLGGLSGGISVALGAFGAHALQSRLSPKRLETFETGVRYQMYHAFAILITAVAAARIDARLVRVSVGSSEWNQHYDRPLEGISAIEQDIILIFRQKGCNFFGNVLNFIIGISRV